MKKERESAFIDLLTMEMNKVIVGQRHMIERLLIGLLGQGHILLEGVPTVKTLAINTCTSGRSFSRIQFTPDLLPADVWDNDLKLNKMNSRGPIFSIFWQMRSTERQLKVGFIRSHAGKQVTKMILL
jgi:MoxR-like ATPase